MNLVTWIWSNIIPFLFVLTIVVFFHELGHFLVARWCGVAVKVFSVGFGPELIGFTDRTGTRWRISAIPLGGYVKFLGDDNAASAPDRGAVDAMSPEDRRRSFAGQGVGARAAIVAAGPIANFLLAIAIFTAIFSIYGRELVLPRVDGVVTGSAAEAAGFKVGDLVLSIDGQAVADFGELQRIVTGRAGETLQIVVERSDGQVTLTAVPQIAQETVFGRSVEVGRLGIQRNRTGSEDVVRETYSLPQAAGLAIFQTWTIAEQSLAGLLNIIVGRASPDQLGGPLQIAQVSAQIASMGFVELLNWVALISVSIGLINLFPIPILDGGHLVYFAAEAIRGQPLSEQVQEVGFRIGLVAILLLFTYVTLFNDLPTILRGLSF